MTNYNSLTISVLAGAGGDDAKDWAQMLLRMYGRYAQLKNWKHEMVSDVTVAIRGEGSYERLKGESGVHRLVRISPFDAKGHRHTSFALVEVLPELPAFEASKIQVPERDLKVEFYRSGGPGGQNVNKVETAVRIVHLPTGLVAASQVERAQAQNRERALALIKAKLVQLAHDQHAASIDALRTKVKPEWGHEIRSYVLHPYQQVKDHKTGKKISRAEQVLDGDLDLLEKAK
ncbi:MAG: peptide chain release factor-like protein [bacterium]|nr:peptide chain release factor-like protein [bacterium]